MPRKCTINATRVHLQTVTIFFEVQGASRETDVFEMDVTEEVESVEAWVGGS